MTKGFDPLESLQDLIYHFHLTSNRLESLQSENERQKQELELKNGHLKQWESMQYDLLRRIRMLEFALQQERKYSNGLKGCVEKAGDLDEVKKYIQDVKVETKLNGKVPPIFQPKFSDAPLESSDMLRQKLRDMNASNVWMLLDEDEDHIFAQDTFQKKELPRENHEPNADEITMDTSQLLHDALIKDPKLVTSKSFKELKKNVIVKEDPSIDTGFQSWKPRYQLLHHMDVVRSLAFHPSESLLVSGSDDWTIKLWQVKKFSKKGVANVPLHTYRGHEGPVYSIDLNSQYIYSAGFDGSIRQWHLPNDSINHDPKTNHGQVISMLSNVYNDAHDDCIFSVTCHPTNENQILSASSDGSVKFWDFDANEKLMQQLPSSKEDVPTCVKYSASSSQHCFVSYNGGRIALFDIEKGVEEWSFQCGNENDVSNCIYQLQPHPILPLLISCHEDGHIRYISLDTNEIIHEFVAHNNAVSSISLDGHSGNLYLSSSGHDLSVRFWDIKQRACLQDLQIHREKYDEGIVDICHSEQRPMLATAGADGAIRILS